MSQPSTTEQLIDSGMTRQFTGFRARISAGMPRVGWKVGINDPVAQQRMSLPGAIVGWLDGDRVIEPGARYSPPAAAKPRIEAEVAITVSSSVPAGATLDDARNAIANVAAAIEFVNGAKPLTPLEELLAHDILHDAFMFGSPKDLALASGIVQAGFPSSRQNGDVVRQGLAGRYPDDLAEIVLHVARTLARYGEELRAGDRIIGGSFIDPFDVATGDRVETDFGPLGTLSFSVA